MAVVSHSSNIELLPHVGYHLPRTAEPVDRAETIRPTETIPAPLNEEWKELERTGCLDCTDIRLVYIVGVGETWLVSRKPHGYYLHLLESNHEGTGTCLMGTCSRFG